jgi:hypothetical protein
LLCRGCNAAEGLVKHVNLIDWAARIVGLREEEPVGAVIIDGPRVVRVRASVAG